MSIFPVQMVCYTHFLIKHTDSHGLGHKHNMLYQRVQTCSFLQHRNQLAFTAQAATRVHLEANRGPMIQRLPQHICLGLRNSFCCPFGSKVLLKLVQTEISREKDNSGGGVKAKLPNPGFYESLWFQACQKNSCYTLMYSNMLTVLWKSRTYSNSVFIFHGSDSMNSNSEDNSVCL